MDGVPANKHLQGNGKVHTGQWTVGMENADHTPYKILDNDFMI